MKKTISKTTLLTLALFCTFGNPATAQQPEQNKQHQKLNNITVHTSAYDCMTNSLYHGHGHDFLSLYGIKYERNLTSSISLFLNYTFTAEQPYLLSKKNAARALGGMFWTPKSNAEWWQRQQGINYYDPNGHLEKLGYYHFIDLGGSYRYEIKEKHEFSASLGLSYATGSNDYVTLIRWAPPMPEGMGDLINYEYVTRHESYIGAVLAVAYDYMLWENRITVGVDASLRKYEGNFPLFTNYGFHAGFNF